MSVFESAVTINKPASVVYAFLGDMNNHRQLMPDSITDWQSTTDQASFNVQNITTLSLKIDERVADTLIRIIPAEKAPFDLELKWELNSASENTEAKFTITADLNMMMKMVASGPLKKLVEEETANLVRLLS
ncbi:SRPBCC family protein [Mucilaginibacter conchicola]|uniref:SRPBCC family protein n=1 Tax=Mucilaginibacter conchicola TaxID=2303333 RepID=A0A372NVL6_9SPHI|nr:SRPBCC family protein [Mucilaginibacter conchicola]RFZ94052.1 SRPBCC family protein [Mucilaginibacter conchicola]